MRLELHWSPRNGILAWDLTALLLAGDPWADTRSEICRPRNTMLGYSLDQWHEQWRSSTVSGTLQPLSPRLPEASPPPTTSSAPIFSYNPADNSFNETSDFRTGNKAQQWLEALPSQHSYYSQQIPHPVPETSTKIVDLLNDVINIHEEVSTKRYQARGLRHALRHKRDEEDDRRVALRNRLNLLSPATVHSESLEINGAIENLQAVTASYLLLEAEYHRFEDDLGQREYILDRHMRRLKRTLRRQAPAGAQQNYHIGSDSDSSVDDTPTDNGNQLSPQAAEYLSCVGEVRMLRERLSDLETEYLTIIDRRHLRERIGLDLNTEALEFLDRYEDETAQAETELELALHRVRTHPEHKTHPESGQEDEDWQQGLEDFLPKPPENEPPPDPLRTSGFEDRSPFFESAHPIPLNKATFVNRWILHQLRHSRFEILRFKSRPELLDLVDRGWDRDSISQMALMLWFRDEATRMVQLRSNSAG